MARKATAAMNVHTNYHAISVPEKDRVRDHGEFKHCVIARNNENSGGPSVGGVFTWRGGGPLDHAWFGYSFLFLFFFSNQHKAQ